MLTDFLRSKIRGYKGKQLLVVTLGQQINHGRVYVTISQHLHRFCTQIVYAKHICFRQFQKLLIIVLAQLGNIFGVFVLIGILGGVLIYYLVEELKKHKFSNLGKVGLTLLNTICSVLLLWYTIYQPTYFNLERWTVALLIAVVITLSLLNQDYLTKLLNNKYTNKIFAYLGSISLEIYMLHYPIAIFVLTFLGKNTLETSYTFWQIFIPTAILTLIFSAILSALRYTIKMLKEQ